MGLGAGCEIFSRVRSRSTTSRGQDRFAKGIGTEYEALQVRNKPYAIASAWNIVSPFLVPEVSGFSRETSRSSSIVRTTVTLRHSLWQRTAMPKSDLGEACEIFGLRMSHLSEAESARIPIFSSPSTSPHDERIYYDKSSYT